MTADTPEILKRMLAMPDTHKVITTFADGRTREQPTKSLAQAENHAVGERRKIGRDLIDRMTGATVRVVSIEIERI